MKQYLRDFQSLNGGAGCIVAVILLIVLVLIMYGMIQTARGASGLGNGRSVSSAAGLQSWMAAKDTGAGAVGMFDAKLAPKGHPTDPDAEPTGFVPSAAGPPRPVAMRGAVGPPPARPPAPPVGKESDHGTMGSAVSDQQPPLASDSRIHDSRSGPARRRRAADGLAQRQGREVPEAFWRALRVVESGDGRNLVGDGGTSVGPYQISRAYFLDGDGDAKDYPRLVYVDSECRKIMLAYWRRYGAVTDEERARCHNSGSEWRSKRHLTDEYWRRVKAAMKGSTDGI